jgi:hypothetical protein
MGATYQRKCGCTYRSTSAASVRKGHELPGYLVKPCPVHAASGAAPAREQIDAKHPDPDTLLPSGISTNRLQEAVDHLAEASVAVSRWLGETDLTPATIHFWTEVKLHQAVLDGLVKDFKHLTRLQGRTA